MNNTPQVLYRYFDADDRLLYIGISSNYQARAVAHSKNSVWESQAVRVELERFPDRESVLAAEKRAIQTERPIHNKIHNSYSWQKPRSHYDALFDRFSYPDDEYHMELMAIVGVGLEWGKSQLPKWGYEPNIRAWALRNAMRDLATNPEARGSDDFVLPCESCERLNKSTFFETDNKNFWIDLGHYVKKGEK